MNRWALVRTWLMGARDPIIWIAAIGLIMYEAIWYPGEPRFSLITLYGAMLGLPMFLKQGDKEEKQPAEPKTEP